MMNDVSVGSATVLCLVPLGLNMEAINASTVRFGSRATLIYVRLVQIVLLLLLLLFLPQKVEGAMAWFPFIGIAACEFAMLGFVQANATPEGITFRRWNAWKVIPWADVQKVEQLTPTKQIVITVSAARLTTRYLLLGRPQPPLDAVCEPGSPAARLKALLGAQSMLVSE